MFTKLLFLLCESLLLCAMGHSPDERATTWLRYVRRNPEPLRNLIRAVEHDGGDAQELWSYFRALYDRPPSGDQEEDDCVGCENIFGMMKTELNAGRREGVVEALKVWCRAVYRPGMHDRYCEGLINIQSRTGLDMMEKYNGTLTKLCQLLNFCMHRSSPSAEKHEQLTERRNVEYGGEHHAGTAAESVAGVVTATGTFTVMQLTDVHINAEYTEGSPTDCQMPTCCYPYYGGNGAARTHGDYRCDVPERTVQLFINKTTQLEPRPAFVLFTGDNAPDKMHNETYEFQRGTTRRITRMFRRVMGGANSTWRIYPAIGNHEMFPTNIFHMGIWETVNMTQEMGDMWADLAGFRDEQLSTWNQAGYYTIMSPLPKLRILGFNSNFGYTMNFYNPLNIDRPEYEEQMNFIRSTLQSAKNNNEKVMMVGHHCPGRQDTHYLWGRAYSDIVREFHDIIVLQVYGHSHRDQFQVITTEDGSRALSVAHISPSVTTGGGVNPSMRIYTFNASTYQLLDVEQHFFDLEKANDAGTDPEIVKSYSAREVYNLTDLSPSSWFELGKRLETDDEVFATFMRNYAAKSRQSPSCDLRCRIGHVCRSITSSYDKELACIRTKMAETETTTEASTESQTTQRSKGSIPSVLSAPPLMFIIILQTIH